MQNHKKDTVEEKKFSLEEMEIRYGVNFSFRSNEDEISMVKQEKIALTPIDGKKVFLIKIKVY